MLKYEQKMGYIAVKFKRTEIGRIEPVDEGFVYSPRATDGNCKTEPFPTLDAVKQHLEGGPLEIQIMTK